MDLTQRLETLSEPLQSTPFGHFSPETNEYVITNIHLPRPWSNVMSNGRYGLVLSHYGGGFSWLDNCQWQRITRWDQDLTLDLHGRFVYVQNLARPERIWSTTYHPTKIEATTEVVRQGMGYTVFERTVEGIRTEQTVFVSQAGQREVWLIRVTNLTDGPIRLALTSYLDLYMGGQGDWHREFQKLFIETEVTDSAILAWKHPGLAEHERRVEELPFVACHSAVGADSIAWCNDKATFLGAPGDLAQPAALLNPSTFKAGEGRWDDPIAACRATIALAPTESRVVAFVLGAEKDREAALQSVRVTVPDLQRELTDVKEHWNDVCSQTTISTPDPVLDTLVNTWLKYQTIAGRMDARCAYYQQGGAYGYRDQLQDSLMCLTHDPARTLRQLKIQAEAMYEDGGVRHWWHPDFPGYSESRHSDTCLWLAYGLLAYIDETNDLASLGDPVRYLSRETQTFASSDTLLGHARRGIDRALARISPRGIPLIGAGDWNDGLSHTGLEGRGESVWMAMFLYDILTRWAPIMDELGHADEAKRYRDAAASLHQAVDAHAWDGAWYLAGINDFGEPFGSHRNRSGQIFLNMQTWSVISGIGTPERTRAAMNSARERLFKPYGALLLAPAYSTVDPNIGYITRYAPGLRENGGVYSHASTWAVIALAKSGAYAEAVQMLRAMLPAKTSDCAELYAAEPYVMPGNVDGPDSPHEGRAGWTWYTGSSAWMVRVALDWVCGVRATREGLVVDPGALAVWPEYAVRRKFRGDTFVIRFDQNARGGPKGPLCGDGKGETFEIVVGPA